MAGSLFYAYSNKRNLDKMGLFDLLVCDDELFYWPDADMAAPV